MNSWILKLAWKLLWSGTHFFFGLGMGPDKQEKGQYGALTGIADFATSEGQSNTLAADNFWKSILSGDPAAMAKVLGPEISGINARAQQKKKTSSEFGNRSGGTNAGNQMADDTTRSSVDELFASLTGHAAGALGSSGSGLLSLGASSHDAAFGEATTMHDQRSAQINDIFSSIASVAAAPFTGGASLGMGTLSKPGKKKSDNSDPWAAVASMDSFS